MVTLLYLPNQLCNRLFQIGNLVAHSMEHGEFPISAPAFLRYSNDFEVGRSDAWMRFPEGGTQLKWSREKCIQAERGLNLLWRLGVLRDGRRWKGGILIDTEKHWNPETQHYTLTDDHFQTALRSYEHVVLLGFRARDKHALFRQREKVNQFLRPGKEFLVSVEEYFDTLNRPKHTFVGVHVRLGDYRQWQGGKFAFEFPVFRAWCEQVREFTGPKTTFVVASNEAMPDGLFEGLDVVAAPGSPMLDLYALARCDLILGAPSTFSSWAAFQRNTPHVHLRSAEHVLRADDFAPPSWDTIP